MKRHGFIAGDMGHRRGLLLAVVSLFFAGLVCSVQADAVKVKRKGRFVRSEIEKTEERPSFRVTLVPSGKPGCICFQVFSIRVKTIHEVKLFETVITYDEFGTVEKNPAIPRVPKVIPGEFIKDERSVHEEIVPAGVMMYETFDFDGITVKTDGKGFVYDTQQHWLEKFDDLSLNSYPITISHAELGKQTIVISRLIIAARESRVPEYRKYSPRGTMDALLSMGINTQIPKGTITSVALDVQCNLPAYVIPGESLAITVTVSNPATCAVGNLILGSFSRDEWLDGKLFYIGQLAPGEKRSFTRLFNVPKNPSSTVSHVELVSWDIVRAQPDRSHHFSTRYVLE